MRIVKPLLKIALSLILIAIVVRAFDVRGVVAQFMKVDAATLLLATAVAVAIAPLHAWRWLAVIGASNHRLGFRTALQVVLIGHFFNQVLPSSVGGDAMRVWCGYRAGLDFGMPVDDAKIWFGIISLVVVEVGLITPPVGLNVFIINSMAPDVPMKDTFKGVLPFLVSDAIRITLLIAFPVLTLILPRLLS